MIAALALCEGLPYLFAIGGVVCRHLKLAMPVPVDQCDPLPHVKLGVCGVDEPLRQLSVAVLDFEQPAVYGGQQ